MRKLTPQNKGGIWYLIRRVPKAVAHLDPRRFVKLTTGIRVVDDPRGIRAREIVARLNESLEEDWREMAAGREPGAERKYERARQMSMSRGFAYVPATELAEGPFDEIVRRIMYLDINRAGPDVAKAVLGCVDPPPFRLSALLEAFEREQAPALKAYSPDQVRKWRNPKRAAIENLIEIVGDKPVKDLKRDDALAFRDWWRDRVLAGDVQIGTANKDLGHISKMLRTIEDAQRLGIDCDAFARLRLAGEESGQRTAYDPQFVQDVILAEGALDGLNEEARRVVYVCADTGLRLSEIVNLLPHHIHLKAAVPHVEIVAEGRKLKTRHSARKMPLVGCALAAMKLQPEGFPRYRDRAASLSALVNKAMSSRGMRPTPDHSLYSLRHTFEDRLTTIDPPDKIIAVLMGHKHSRPKYGAGPTLEHLKSWLKRIAFQPPASI